MVTAICSGESDLDEQGLKGAAELVVAKEAGGLLLPFLLFHLRRSRDEVVEQHSDRHLQQGGIGLDVLANCSKILQGRHEKYRVPPRVHPSDSKGR